MTLEQALQSIAAGGVAGAVLGALVQHFLAVRFRAGIEHEYAKRLEDHKTHVQVQFTGALERVRSEVAERVRLDRERWEIKRGACLAALSLVDKVMTNILWEDRDNPGTVLRIARSRVDPAEARDVMNRLILSCDDPGVVRLFLTCLGLQESGESAASIDPGSVQHLRDAVRLELGFGKPLTLNPNLAWIMSVHGDQVVVDTDQERNAARQRDGADGA
jgi:hypothetical protein